MTGIVSAARRVALTVRNDLRGRGGPAFDPADLAALLPVLDAVAAGPGHEGRLERWANDPRSDRGSLGAVIGCAALDATVRRLAGIP